MMTASEPLFEDLPEESWEDTNSSSSNTAPVPIYIFFGLLSTILGFITTFFSHDVCQAFKAGSLYFIEMIALFLVSQFVEPFKLGVHLAALFFGATGVFTYIFVLFMKNDS